MEVLSGVFTSVVVQKEHGIGDFLVTFYFSVLMSIINLLQQDVAQASCPTHNLCVWITGFPVLQV